MAKAGTTILDGADAVLTNHYMIRDGSFWACRNGCGTTVPFPSVMPDSASLGDCVPRRWGDGEVVVDGRPAEVELQNVKLPNEYRPVRGGPSVLMHECPKCQAPIGEPCRDGRGRRGQFGDYPTLRPHQERR